MIVNSTECQNNFGKYLQLAGKEDIVITRNGTAIAKLSAIGRKDAVGSESLESRGGVIREEPLTYGFGKKATYEEFLELTRVNEERMEYIDGEIYFLVCLKLRISWC